MRNILTTLATVFFLSSALAAPSADELLKSSDRARGGISKGVVWEAELISEEEGEKSERKFNVKAKGNDALVEITHPSRNKGEKFLFNDLTMWFHKPSLRKPVSISPRQRNSGQAANGDIASIQYARDYSGTVKSSEVVNGEKAWLVELKAKSKSVTYDQIKYWISDKDKLGIKAEYLTLQGKPFKRATFEYNNSVTVNGKKEPFISRMVIEDSQFPENKSTMTYKNPKETNLSDSLFNINNLSR